MDGEGKLRGRDKQGSLLYWETFLSQLGRAGMPRVYLFDGGYVQDDQKLLQKSKVFGTETSELLRFLPMNEVENYLLVPEPILGAMTELIRFQGIELPILDAVILKQKIDEILSQVGNRKLYPNEPGKDLLRSAKGSVVLEMLFDSYGLRFEKRRTGRLIATKISADNQPLLKEIWDLFPLDFLPHLSGSVFVKRPITPSAAAET
jgi:hypothetical protein